MKDYREILEEVTKERRCKSGRNWLVHILKIEKKGRDCRFSEKSAYYAFQNIKSFFLDNYTKMITGRTVRRIVYSSIKNYDENYVADIDNLLYIVDIYKEIDDCSKEEILNSIEKIFYFSDY